MRTLYAQPAQGERALPVHPECVQQDCGRKQDPEQGKHFRCQVLAFGGEGAKFGPMIGACAAVLSPMTQKM